MTELTRRETLFMTTGATWAAALEARAEDPPKVADQGPPGDSKPDRRLVSLRDFERLAPGKMTRDAWEFISSGAGDEHTVRWNEEAFGRRRLRQRALEDVSAPRHPRPPLRTRAAAPDPSCSDFQPHAGPPRRGSRDGARGGGRRGHDGR